MSLRLNENDTVLSKLNGRTIFSTKSLNFRLEILEAISAPFMIRLDVFALTSSTTRDNLGLLYPSAPTAFNKTQKILHFGEMEKLRLECNDPGLYQSILERHQLVRGFAHDEGGVITSGLSITKIISLWCHVIKL